MFIIQKLGVAFKSECLDLAKSCNSKDDIPGAIGYYLLSPKPQKALDIGFGYLRDLLRNSHDYTSRDIEPIISRLNFTPESVVKELSIEYQKNLWCLSFYNGALLAIRRRYDRIALYLFENVK